MYIYDNQGWPDFTWDQVEIAQALSQTRFTQGLLLGKISAIGFTLQEEATLQMQTSNIIKSSEIEGEHLDRDEVRSSIARHLGISVAGQLPRSRSIDGVVEMHLDATQRCKEALTESQLYAWHAMLFPTAYSGARIINPGCLRSDRDGPMQVVSGRYGRERIHFEAPAAKRLPKELRRFIAWFNGDPNEDLLIRAAIAHLWFVTLHPFEDGNGRIARAVADRVLAQSDNQQNRYYSMSTQIQRERKQYYDILESTQKDNLDITAWLIWFLNCLERAIHSSELILKNVLNKATFWERHAAKSLNERQIAMLNILFDGFIGTLSTSKWGKMMKCSQDTASRDIHSLIEKNILVKNAQASGRSTHYLLKDFPIKQRGSGK